MKFNIKSLQMMLVYNTMFTKLKVNFKYDRLEVHIIKEYHVSNTHVFWPRISYKTFFFKIQ